MALDVGSLCSNRASSQATSYTFVAVPNPASADGTIDTCEVWANTNMSGIEYASFSASGNVLTTNGDTNGSNLSANVGSCVQHTAAGNDFTAFAIASGEYIGVYYTGGKIEATITGANGIWYDGADDIPCTNVTFSHNAAREVSVHATGTEAGPAAGTEAAISFIFSMMSNQSGGGIGSGGGGHTTIP